MKTRFQNAFIAVSLCALAVAGCRERAQESTAIPVEEPPVVAPELLRMPAVAGEGQFAMADFRGKVLLVSFFASGMDECRAEIVPLNTMVAELGSRPFALLGIAMDLKKPQIYVASDLRSSPPHFPYVLGGRAARQAFPEVKALPTKWLLDRDGKVVKRYEGGTPLAEIRADIEGLLK